MKKEWYTAMELTGIGGLPKSPQGVNAKAKRESWLKQKRTNKQGNGVEYHYSCLSEETLIALELYEPLAHYKLNKEEPLVIWVKAFQQLNDGEQKTVTELILRDGIRSFLEKIVKD
ncbi:TPA: putative DNA-binding transcriptional regulator [Proteus mirabilis]|nr:putative DNA-binding transcriptional regulator [Proteus mirabilis]